MRLLFKNWIIHLKHKGRRRAELTFDFLVHASVISSMKPNLSCERVICCEHSFYCYVMQFGDISFYMSSWVQTEQLHIHLSVRAIYVYILHMLKSPHIHAHVLKKFWDIIMDKSKNITFYCIFFLNSMAT